MNDYEYLNMVIVIKNINGDDDDDDDITTVLIIMFPENIFL